MQIRFCLCESNLRVAVTDRQQHQTADGQHESRLTTHVTGSSSPYADLRYLMKAIFGCTKRESSTRRLHRFSSFSKRFDLMVGLKDENVLDFHDFVTIIRCDSL